MHAKFFNLVRTEYSVISRRPNTCQFNYYNMNLQVINRNRLFLSRSDWKYRFSKTYLANFDNCLVILMMFDTSL